MKTSNRIIESNDLILGFSITLVLLNSEISPNIDVYVDDIAYIKLGYDRLC
jgi:hypothetical protein